MTYQSHAAAQIGSCPITFLWLWPATDYEPHSRHVPADKIRRWTETTARSGWWHSHVAGINSDHSTREMKRTSLMTYNRPFWRHALEYEGIMFVLSTAETRRLWNRTFFANITFVWASTMSSQPLAWKLSSDFTLDTSLKSSVYRSFYCWW